LRARRFLGCFGSFSNIGGRFEIKTIFFVNIILCITQKITGYTVGAIINRPFKSSKNKIIPRNIICGDFCGRIIFSPTDRFHNLCEIYGLLHPQLMWTRGINYAIRTNLFVIGSNATRLAGE
jgi:hypothetical protein